MCGMLLGCFNPSLTKVLTISRICFSTIVRLLLKRKPGSICSTPGIRSFDPLRFTPYYILPANCKLTSLFSNAKIYKNSNSINNF